MIPKVWVPSRSIIGFWNERNGAGGSFRCNSWCSRMPRRRVSASAIAWSATSVVP